MEFPASNTRNRWIGGFSQVIPARVIAPFVSQRIRATEMAQYPADLITLTTEFIQAGTLTPVIDRTYSLIETPVAIRYLQHGHARGNVVILV